MPIIQRLSYRTSNGHLRTEHVEVTDFLGASVLFMSTDQFLGHLRWFRPKIISFFRGVNGVYPGARGDEVQIETEDIH